MRWHLPHLPSKDTAFPTRKEDEALLQTPIVAGAPLPPPALATSIPAKTRKERSVSARKEVYYNSRCSNPGKEVQSTPTPRSVCRRMPTHGLCFCAVSTMRSFAASPSINHYHHVTVVSIVASILTRGIYHTLLPGGRHSPQRCPSVIPHTQDVPPVCVVLPPTGGASLLFHNVRTGTFLLVFMLGS